MRNGTFLHALFWRSVWKNCPSVIWYFSWVSRLKNMESRMFLARGRRPRAEIIRDSMFFNRDTQGKLSNFTRTDFPTLSQKNAWRRMLFRIFWFFHTSLRSILPHFPLFPTVFPQFFHELLFISPSFDEICLKKAY